MGIVIEEVVARVESPPARSAARGSQSANDRPGRLAVHRELERHAERRQRLQDRRRDD